MNTQSEKAKLNNLLNKLPAKVREQHLKYNIPVYTIDENGNMIAIYPRGKSKKNKNYST